MNPSFVFSIATISIVSAMILLLRDVYIQSLRASKKDWSTVPKKQLIETIIQWACNKIIYGRNRRIKPHIHLIKQTKGDVLGTYFFDSKTILIYYKKHNNLSSLVETVLHEYIHHLQLRHTKDKSKYMVLLRKTGYTDNPYEVEARKLAAKYLKACLRDLPVA